MIARVSAPDCYLSFVVSSAWAAMASVMMCRAQASRSKLSPTVRPTVPMGGVGALYPPGSCVIKLIKPIRVAILPIETMVMMW